MTIVDTEINSLTPEIAMSSLSVERMLEVVTPDREILQI